MPAIAYKPSTAAGTMKERRQVRQIGPGVYQVVSRDATKRYRIFLLQSGETMCSCPARGDCWHAQLVRERRGREMG